MNNNDLYDDVITCRNCGTINIKGTKKCIRCGKRLNYHKKKQNPSIINTAISKIKENNNNKNSNNDLVAFMASNNSINKNTIDNKKIVKDTNANINNQVSVDTKQEKIPAEKINYISYIINSFLKPFDKYNSEKNNFNFMNTSILLGIISIALSVVSLFSIVINIIRVNSIFSNKVLWKFDRLVNINYFKILFVNIFMFAGIIIGIALVYYLASLIILKKKTNFNKLVGATITAFIPLVITVFIGQLLALISSFFGLAVVSIGGIYSFIILIELINYNIEFDNNDRSSFIYFNSICLSIVVLILGPIFYNVIASFFSGFVA